MAFDCEERKTLLYADLFKSRTNMVVGTKQNQNRSIMSSWSWNQLSSTCDSFSSGFSTPVSSELGSSESDDGDFIAELTRQMAECMHQEQEQEQEEEWNQVITNSMSGENHENCVDSSAIKNLKYGLHSNQYPVSDNMDPTPRGPLQVYQLKNQPPVNKEVPVSRGRRVKGIESAQLKQLEKREQHYVRYRGGRDWRIGQAQGGKGQAGSGMRAIFLGGSGSRNGSSGTGVFLPRAAKDPVELKKIPGCSTVLIPTRVLQALELHFSRFSDSASAAQLLRGGSPNHSCPQDNANNLRYVRYTMSAEEWSRSKGQFQVRPANISKDDQETQLPQEWTY